tara:strand:+ start:95 stop:562 length:468 start_codon:yes stop_codon:yes gene_type:complete
MGWGFGPFLLFTKEDNIMTDHVALLDRFDGDLYNGKSIEDIFSSTPEDQQQAMLLALADDEADLEIFDVFTDGLDIKEPYTQYDGKAILANFTYHAIVQEPGAVYLLVALAHSFWKHKLSDVLDQQAAMDTVTISAMRAHWALEQGAGDMKELSS